MPENATRDQAGLYDHESDGSPRRRPADDWGIDESFPRVRGRRFARHDGAVRDARAQEGPARRRRRPVEDWGADDAFDGGASPGPEPEALAGLPKALTEAPTDEESIVAEIADAPEPEVVSEDGRRTIRINGRPGEVSEIAPFTSAARRRRPPLTVEERLAGDPTRIIAWAFLLGLLLILIAVLTS